VNFIIILVLYLCYSKEIQTIAQNFLRQILHKTITHVANQVGCVGCVKIYLTHDVQVKGPLCINKFR